jgi:hypothetical protein
MAWTAREEVRRGRDIPADGEEEWCKMVQGVEGGLLDYKIIMRGRLRQLAGPTDDGDDLDEPSCHEGAPEYGVDPRGDLERLLVRLERPPGNDDHQPRHHRAPPAPRQIYPQPTRTRPDHSQKGVLEVFV